MLPVIWYLKSQQRNMNFLLYINLRQRIGILFPEETSHKTRICALYFPFSWFVLYRGGSRQQIGCTVGVTFGKAEMSVKVKTVFGVFARSSCVFRELVANSGQIHLKTRSGEKANSGQIHKFNLLKQTSKASQTRCCNTLLCLFRHFCNLCLKSTVGYENCSFEKRMTMIMNEV